MALQTEDLIARLAADARPVDTHRILRTTLIASILGLAAAIMLVVETIGMRRDWATAWGDPRVLAKILFVLAATAASALAFLRLARPGRTLKPLIGLLALPFAGIAALASVELGMAGPQDMPALVFGSSWTFCLAFLPLYAIVPFVALVMVLRASAPTDLTGAGFAAGLFAGSLASIAYAVHCTEDAMAFVAAWYAGAILIVGLAGALLAPRLVRW
ncbi:DUF1109 domain-containing protein [Prosthecomicrobium hirschii]|uniref:DUF1109 domain-containing protein n=1 Tax=Prosthecodimorpha hirschii TaxID=665126 RepID=UPI0009F8873B|nr:DUF1109 domain-containing protein [Prosthecomicrobium hirschii]